MDVVLPAFVRVATREFCKTVKVIGFRKVTMAKFEDIENGVPITLKYVQAMKVKGTKMNFACCDCGLVHNIVLMPLKTRIKVYFWRDNRRTANRRRRKDK